MLHPTFGEAFLQTEHIPPKLPVVFDFPSVIFQSNLLCFLAGLGGACGYLIGAMDWGHSALGVVLGSEYQVIYFFSSLTWGIFLTMHLFSIPEKPLMKDYSSDSCPAASLLLEEQHHNGYGAVHKELPPLPEIRQRSFSVLSEANAVTPSAKQPSSEVGHLCYLESLSCGFYSWLQSAPNFPSHFNDLFQTLKHQPLRAVIRLHTHAFHRNYSVWSIMKWAHAFNLLLKIQEIMAC